MTKGELKAYIRDLEERDSDLQRKKDKCEDVCKEQAKEIERLHAVRSQELADAVDGERDRWLYDYQQQAKRIRGLEAALIDAKTKEILAVDDGLGKFKIGAVHECPVIGLSCDEECNFDACPSKDFWRRVAHAQLHAEGKL